MSLTPVEQPETTPEETEMGPPGSAYRPNPFLLDFPTEEEPAESGEDDGTTGG